MNKKIVIASVLKPTDDVRAYWKIAQSVTKANKYDVNIIGNHGKIGVDKNNIHFRPHSVRRNQWLKRIAIRELLFLKILKYKPDLLIITTYELINTAFLTKLFSGCKIVYDVQENYAQNTVLQKGIFRQIQSVFIQIQEWLGSLFIDHYWLAEDCYKDQLPWLKNNFSIIQNKAIKQPSVDRKNAPIRALFSGTVSEYSEANLALTTMIELIKTYPDTQAIMIGQVHDIPLRKELESRAKQFPAIELQLSENPIAYAKILGCIKWANLGIISYQENPVNRKKIPTKLYEYSRYQLPFLVQQDTHWHQIGLKLGGVIPIDFQTQSYTRIVENMQKSQKDFSNNYPKEATWEFESEKIDTSINILINS